MTRAIDIIYHSKSWAYGQNSFQSQYWLRLEYIDWDKVKFNKFEWDWTRLNEIEQDWKQLLHAPKLATFETILPTVECKTIQYNMYFGKNLGGQCCTWKFWYWNVKCQSYYVFTYNGYLQMFVI